MYLKGQLLLNGFLFRTPASKCRHNFNLVVTIKKNVKEF